MSSRMFHIIGMTWNPITGCLHGCLYCWARRLVNTRLKNKKKYRMGFRPTFHEHELKVKFRPNEMVFVADMGDMWGIWVPKEWILKVLNHISKFNDTTFLLLTKNPARYLEFKDALVSMPNVILGSTIETDDSELYRKHGISKAPPPDERIRAMVKLRDMDFTNLMVSIEPVLDFTHSFDDAIAEIDPMFVYVGYDNYNHRLPEPPLSKVRTLIRHLRSMGIVVHEKTIRPAWYERKRNNIGYVHSILDWT